MSRTIEAIIDKSAPVNHHAIRAQSKRLMTNWQTEFESGNHPHGELRLDFTNVAAHHPA